MSESSRVDYLEASLKQALARAREDFLSAGFRGAAEMMLRAERDVQALADLARQKGENDD